MTNEEIIEITDTLKANDKTMKDNGISDNLWGKAVECIMFLQSENAALRERLEKSVELPIIAYNKSADRYQIISGKNSHFFASKFYMGKDSKQIKSRFAELKGEKGKKEKDS